MEGRVRRVTHTSTSPTSMSLVNTTTTTAALGLTGHAEVELVLHGLLVGKLARAQRPQAQPEGPDVRLGRQLVCLSGSVGGMIYRMVSRASRQQPPQQSTFTTNKRTALVLEALRGDVALRALHVVLGLVKRHRQPKVPDLDEAVRRHEQVPRLHVPVHHVPLVQVVQALRVWVRGACGSAPGFR